MVDSLVDEERHSITGTRLRATVLALTRGPARFFVSHECGGSGVRLTPGRAGTLPDSKVFVF